MLSTFVTLTSAYRTSSLESFCLLVAVPRLDSLGSSFLEKSIVAYAMSAVAGFSFSIAMEATGVSGTPILKLYHNHKSKGLFIH